jgi:hypothetical protein
MLQGRGGREGRNVDGGLLKDTEYGKVHCVDWVVAARDPGLVPLCKEACAMDDMNTNVNNVLARLANIAPWNRCMTRSSNPL